MYKKKKKKAKPNLLYKPCTLFSIGLFTRKPCLLKGRLHCLKFKSVLNPVNVYVSVSGAPSMQHKL